MANRDCGVGVPGLLNKNRSHRFANNIAATQDDNFGAGQRHVTANEQFVNAGGSAGDEACRIAEEQLAHVVGMKAIDVFVGVDRGINLGRIDVVGNRRLDEDAVDVLVLVE